MLAFVEQAHDFAGATGGHLLSIGHTGDWLIAFQLPDIQRSGRLTIDLKQRFAPLGFGRPERHLIVIAVTEQKGPAPLLTLLGAPEYMIDGLDHGMAGAKVFIQRVPAPSGGRARAQVGVDVSATERVDRLLGIAYEEEAGIAAVLFEAVDALENPVLHGVGVLELIDQCHGELFTNQGRQTLAPGAAQCRIEPEQHVIETHLCSPTLLFFEACAYPLRSVFKHGGIRRR